MTTRATGGTLVGPAPDSQLRHPRTAVRGPFVGTYTRARGQPKFPGLAVVETAA